MPHASYKNRDVSPVGRRRIALAILQVTTAFLIGSAAQLAHATTFHARDEIGSLAFPDSERVETRNLFLTAEQRARIETMAGSRLESDLVTVYEGYRNGNRLGHALLDSHLVRTLSETLLIVMDADGRVTATYVMAFHEPTEYMPNARWLRLLEDKPLSADLRVGRSIVGITGSTLSARAVVAAVRRALSLYNVVLAED